MYRKVFLIFAILLMSFGVTGWSWSRKPKDEQILNDLNQDGYKIKIRYYPSTLYESYELKYKSIKKVEKSDTGNKRYEAWLQLEAKNSVLEGKVFMHVIYKGYDNNVWELEDSDYYKPKENKFTYTGRINEEAVKRMFSKYEEIGVKVLESSSKKATVKITGINKNGYYDVSKKKELERDVAFETVADLIFDEEEMAWRLGETRSNSRSNTPIDGEFIKQFMEEAGKNYLEKNIKNLEDWSNFKIDITKDNLSGKTIVNDGNYPELNCEYLAQVNTQYYSCTLPMSLSVSFANDGLFQYTLQSEMDKSDMQEEWRVNRTFPIESKIYSQDYSGSMTIDYPYHDDKNVAYVSITQTDENSVTKKSSGEYAVNITTGKSPNIEIPKVELPVYGLGKWTVYKDTIYIYPEKIGFSSSFYNKISILEKTGKTSAQVLAETSEDYILKNSDVVYLKEDDIVGLTAEQLRLARNEIYARHGRKFKDELLQEYFNSKSWYRGSIEPDDFSDDQLSKVEKKNLELIKSREDVLN